MGKFCKILASEYRSYMSAKEKASHQKATADEINAYIKRTAPRSTAKVKCINGNFFTLSLARCSSYRFWRKELERKFGILIFSGKVVHNKKGEPTIIV